MPHDKADGFFRRGTTNSVVPVTQDPFERTPEQIVFLKSNDKERRAVLMVRDFMERSDAYRKPHMELAIQSRRLYENWQDSGNTIVGRARIRSSVGFTIIESLTPQLHTIFFSDDQVVELEGKDIFSAPLELPMSEFINRQLKEAQAQTKGYAYQKATLLDGTGIAKIPYKFIEQTQTIRTRQRDELTGEIIMEKREETVAKFDGPDIELISIQNFFPDWAIKEPGNIKGMRACAHRVYKTLNELKQDGSFKNLDEVQVSTRTRGTNIRGTTGQLQAPYWGEDFRDEDDRMQDNFAEAKTAGKMEIWEYWGDYDPKGDGKYEQWMLVIANGDVIIKEQKNPFDTKFKPFVATPNYPRDGEFFGIPELVMQKFSIKELNSLKNARLDAVNMSVNPMWKVQRNSGYNLKQLIYKPGGVLLADDINGLQRLETNDPSPASAGEISQIQQEISTTAALGIATSALSTAGKTLGRTTAGVDLISSFADNRITLKAQIMSETFFQPMTQMFLAHNRQFISDDQIVKISNPELAQVDPEAALPVEAFSVDFSYKVKTDFEGGNTAGFIEKLNTALPIIQAIQQSNPFAVKVDVLGNQLLRRLFKTSFPRFVNSPDEQQALRDQQVASEQAVNAEIGRNAPQPNE